MENPKLDMAAMQNSEPYLFCPLRPQEEIYQLYIGGITFSIVQLENKFFQKLIRSEGWSGLYLML